MSKRGGQGWTSSRMWSMYERSSVRGLTCPSVFHIKDVRNNAVAVWYDECPFPAEAEAHASTAIGAGAQQAQGLHSSSTARTAARPPEAAQGPQACAFAFPPLQGGSAQMAVRHERLPPPLVLPTCEAGIHALYCLSAMDAPDLKLHTCLLPL